MLAFVHESPRTDRSPHDEPRRGISNLEGNKLSWLEDRYKLLIAALFRPCACPEQLFPQYMKDAGYETHMIGKWHLGSYTQSYIPSQRGFDTYMGYLNDEEMYWSHQVWMQQRLEICWLDASVLVVILVVVAGTFTLLLVRVLMVFPYITPVQASYLLLSPFKRNLNLEQGKKGRRSGVCFMHACFIP